MRRLVALLAALVAWLAPAPARAQAGVEGLLREAYALRLAGRDAEALPRLLAAYATAPTPRVAGQLGTCEAAVAAWSDAATHLRAALTAPTDPWVVRNRAALESTLTLVTEHLDPPSDPRDVPAVRRDGLPESAAVFSGSRESAAPHPPGSRNPPRRSDVVPVRRVVAWSALGAGAALAVGGAVAWGAREAGVRAFDDRGCRVGDPAPAAGCDAAGAVAARDAATGLAAAGLVAGAAGLAAGAVLLGLPARPARLACAPAGAGVACGGRF